MSKDPSDLFEKSDEEMETIFNSIHGYVDHLTRDLVEIDTWLTPEQLASIIWMMRRLGEPE